MPRQPAMGLNSNPLRGEVEYHVQTEDLPLKSKVRTQVFINGGTVVFTDIYGYEAHLGKSDLSTRLVKVMRACHQKVVLGVQQGTLELTEVTPPAPPVLAQKPSGIRPRTPSEVWDSLVREAHRRNPRIKSSTRPPPAWDLVVENLRRSG